MVLELNGALRERLRHWARQGYPHECCGLLLGTAADGAVRVEEVTTARNLNTERAQDRFELDPQDFLRADALARERGLEVVGVWHTHPDHPALPSATDLDSAWEGWSYLILSVAAQGVPAMRSWRLAGREFVEEDIA
jgi:proteasome lid subunit RPN8/RPN11